MAEVLEAPTEQVVEQVAVTPKLAMKRRTNGNPNWKKGVSANPSGRPKADLNLRELARAHTQAALDTLVAALQSCNDRTRVAAADALLDRGYGKPMQSMDVTGIPAPQIVILKHSHELLDVAGRS